MRHPFGVFFKPGRDPFRHFMTHRTNNELHTVGVQTFVRGIQLCLGGFIFFNWGNRFSFSWGGAAFDGRRLEQ